MASGFKRTLLLVMVFILSTTCMSDYSSDERDIEEETQTLELWKELFLNYDKRIRPYFGTDRPVNVSINLGIISFESVSETTLDFTINTYLVQTWTDPRLRYNSTFQLPPTSSLNDQIWLPDLIFVNAKFATVHDVTLENRVAQIFPNGTVFLIQRLRLVLACAMDFRLFPFDEQRCPIDMESFEYISDELIFHFDEAIPIFVFQEDLQLPQFIVRGATLENCTKNLKIGYISCISAKIFFQREFRYYMFHAFVPAIMLVILSWVSFMIDITCAPARVSLGITIILTMLTSTIGVQKDLPKVAYLKAIDVWFVINLLFVIAALMEYSLVHYIGIQMPSARYFHAVKKHEEELHANANKRDVDDGGESRKVRSVAAGSRDLRSIHCLQFRVDKTIEDGPAAFKDALDQCYLFVGVTIDRCCRVIFPIVYTLFLFLFFVIATPHSEEPELSQDTLEDYYDAL